MKVKLLEQAKNDLQEMDNSVYLDFIHHLRKISEIPFQRHLKHGLPFYVEEAGQGRIIFTIDNDIISILRCFPKHKEYEKWYKQFKKMRDTF